MSWRVSYWKADKNEPLKREDEIDEETGEVIYSSYVPNGEEILNNEGTQIWLEEISDDEKANPDLFEEIVKDEDCHFFKVKKQGLKLLINKYKEQIIKMFRGMLDKNSEYMLLEHYAERKLWMWEHDLEINLKENYRFCGVTTSSFWEYTIFNLVYLYQNFDFDNYELVLYGG